MECVITYFKLENSFHFKARIQFQKWKYVNAFLPDTVYNSFASVIVLFVPENKLLPTLGL